MDSLTLFDKILGGGFLAGKKTYIAAIALIVAGIAGYFTGDATLVETITLIANGLGFGGLKSSSSRDN